MILTLGADPLAEFVVILALESACDVRVAILVGVSLELGVAFFPFSYECVPDEVEIIEAFFALDRHSASILTLGADPLSEFKVIFAGEGV